MCFFLEFSESYCKAVGGQSCTGVTPIHHPNSSALFHSFPHELVILINDISENMSSCFKKETANIREPSKMAAMFPSKFWQD